MTDPKAKDNPTPARRKRETNGPAFLLDAHFFRDPKVRRLRKTHGLDACFAWMAIVGELRANGLKLDQIFIDDLGEELGVEAARWDEIINTCFELGLLYFDGEISCPALNRRIENYNEVVERNRGAGQASAEARRKRAVEIIEEIIEEPTTECSTECSTEKKEVFNTPNIIQTNLTQSNLIQSSEGEPEREPPRPSPEPPDPPPPLEIRTLSSMPHLADAESRLEPPGEQPWTKQNGWIMFQRRPMFEYPEVHISAHELAQVLEHFSRQKLPKQDWKGCFLEAQQLAKKHLAQGRPLGLAPVQSWLLNFICEHGLDRWRKREQAQRAAKGYQNETPGKNRPRGSGGDPEAIGAIVKRIGS